MKTHTLSLEGVTPSKKNSLRPRKRGGYYNDPAVAEALAPLQLQAQLQWKGKPPLERVSAVRAVFYVSSRRSDLDNKYTALQDVLVKAGVLKDDNMAVVSNLHISAYKTRKGDERVVVALDE